MLRCESRKRSDGFLSCVEQGTVPGYDVRYCRITFNNSKYSMDLFQHFGVTLPPHIEQAVTKRQIEYLAGRMCCKYALDAIGITEEVRSAYPERAPVWPAGVSGSISHCAACAIAVVARDGLHVGVDIEELDAALMTTHAEMFTSADERLHLTSPTDLLVVFSAKEALFKTLYPRLRQYFGFECAAVKITGPTLFNIRLTCPLGPGFPQDRTWVGRYSLDGCAITTLLIDDKPCSD